QRGGMAVCARPDQPARVAPLPVGRHCGCRRRARPYSRGVSRQPERHAETTLLLDRWHAGDREALDRLVSTHLEWIRARLHERQGALLRERAETGDYVQQTLLEFLRYGPPFRLTDGDRFRGLLLTIAENVL